MNGKSNPVLRGALRFTTESHEMGLPISINIQMPPLHEKAWKPERSTALRQISGIQFGLNARNPEPLRLPQISLLESEEAFQRT
jgi:hypothetical protein